MLPKYTVNGGKTLNNKLYRWSFSLVVDKQQQASRINVSVFGRRALPNAYTLRPTSSEGRVAGQCGLRTEDPLRLISTRSRSLCSSRLMDKDEGVALYGSSGD